MPFITPNNSVLFYLSGGYSGGTMPPVMHPKEKEIREVATRAPFIPFTLVTASGERYKVPTSDHIFFFPDTDEDGVLETEEERAQCFIVHGRGVRYRLLFFDTITAIDLGGTPNPVAEQ